MSEFRIVLITAVLWTLPCYVNAQIQPEQEPQFIDEGVTRKERIYTPSERDLVTKFVKLDANGLTPYLDKSMEWDQSELSSVFDAIMRHIDLADSVTTIVDTSWHSKDASLFFLYFNITDFADISIYCNYTGDVDNPRIYNINISAFDESWSFPRILDRIKGLHKLTDSLIVNSSPDDMVRHFEQLDSAYKVARRQAVVIDNCWEARNLLAVSWFALHAEQWDKSYEALEKAKELCPFRIAQSRCEVISSLATGRYNDALSICNRLVKYDPVDRTPFEFPYTFYGPQLGMRSYPELFIYDLDHFESLGIIMPRSDEMRAHLIDTLTRYLWSDWEQKPESGWAQVRLKFTKDGQLFNEMGNAELFHIGIQDTNGKMVKGRITDPNLLGHYMFKKLRPGSYRIVIEGYVPPVEGFEWSSDVVLEAGDAPIVEVIIDH